MGVRLAKAEEDCKTLQSQQYALRYPQHLAPSPQGAPPRSLNSQGAPHPHLPKGLSPPHLPKGLSPPHLPKGISPPQQES